MADPYYFFNPGSENDGTLIGRGWTDTMGHAVDDPYNLGAYATDQQSRDAMYRAIWESVPGATPAEKYENAAKSGVGNVEIGGWAVQNGLLSEQELYASPSYQYAKSFSGPHGLARLGRPALALGAGAMLGGMAYTGLGAMGALGGAEGAAGAGAYGGMDAGAVAGADYGAGALGAGGLEYGIGQGAVTNAADQVAYGGIPGEVGATMPAAQAMAPGAVAGAQMGGALPELGIEAGMAGAAGAGALGGAALGGAAGTAAGNAVGQGFDWNSLPQNAAGLLQGMDWLGLGSDLLGLNAQRDYQKDLISTLNRAIDYSDPAYGQRPFYQGMYKNMQTDPNWMQNDQLLQNMMNQSMRGVSSQNAAQGYMGSGNILHDLTRTANETIAPYGLQRMQQIGEAGGILGGRQNASQAIGSLGQAAGQAGLGQTQSIQSMMGRLPRQGINTGISNTLGGLFGTF